MLGQIYTFTSVASSFRKLKRDGLFILNTYFLTFNIHFQKPNEKAGSLVKDDHAVQNVFLFG